VVASRASRGALAGALATLALLAAPSPAAADAPLRPTLRAAWTAQVVIPTLARRSPAGRRLFRLGTEARWGGGPVRLLVLRGARDGRDRLWLRVRLHTRPNDAAAWIPADRTRLRRTRWRVRVSTRARTVTVLRAGRPVRRFGAVVGAPGTPTPHGLFAIAERIRQRGGVLGPWALHLTAHSRVLFDFGGGKGRVAIHGRSGPLLADPLGSAASHGCVRLANGAVAWLAARALEGTPVVVRP
jgi:L,D-transpeptidase catalytic domain